MVTILSVNSELVFHHSRLEQLLEQIPSSMQARAFRYRRKEDAFNYAIGRLLIKEALKRSNLPVERLEDIHYNEFDKPLIEGLFFSISHSGNQVLCAFTQDCEIGVDIEQRKTVKLELFKAWFSDRNWEKVFAAEDPLIPFFKLWSQKESVLKALGTGLSQLKDVEILNDQQAVDGKRAWYLQNLAIAEGYTAALCSAQQDIEIVVEPFMIK